MEIFAVYDKKGNIYIPFLAPNAFDAQKALSFDVNMKANGGTVLSNNPSDFALYRLGSIQDNGDVLRTPMPLFVAECLNLVIRESEDKLANVENTEDVFD